MSNTLMATAIYRNSILVVKKIFRNYLKGNEGREFHFFDKAFRITILNFFYAFLIYKR